MFYNIHTNVVEDYTGNGLLDLENHIIRTPLAPRETFLDDPLRVLRVIRFASRFNFAIAPEILSATSDQSVRDAFEKKISRERVGVEIEKMLRGPYPGLAIRLIGQFHFYDLIFACLDAEKLQGNDQSRSNQSIKFATLLEKYFKAPNCRLFEKGASDILWNSSTLIDDDRYHLYLACTLLPFRKLTLKVKNREQSQAKHIVCHSLKLSVLQGDTVERLLVNASAISDAVKLNSTNSLDRKTCGMIYLDLFLGLLIRNLGSRPLGKSWDLAVLVSLINDLAAYDSVECDDAKTCITLYTNFIEQVYAYSLQDAFDLKPLLDGKSLASLLNLKPGPQLGVILQDLIEWQLEQSDPSEEEAINFLKRKYAKD